MSRISNFVHHYFNLDKDRDDEATVIQSITNNISFRGTNLWTLIFAIIIASVGLNVNSTAVIIGAMLISPLMGPIMGVGLGIAISDFDLVRRGLKNLMIAVAFSIATSTVYFYVTPLHNVNSELLARTTPTIWDVFIAFAGGLAGIVGVTRREKGNVIPGVAIATALMPPLCTVGYGIATQHWYYSLGAIYLFFINSVFICIATVLIVRFMRFHKHQFQNDARRKRMTRYILLVVIVTITPSIWLAYRIVQKTVFENAAGTFVRKEFNLLNTQVVSKNLVFDTRHPKIELLLFGELLDSSTIAALKSKLPAYNLSQATLIVRQGLNARQEIDFAQVKASILDEVFKNADSSGVPVANTGTTPKVGIPDIKRELSILFPAIHSYSLTRTETVRIDTSKAGDSALLFVANSKIAMRATEKRRLEAWVAARFPKDSVQVVLGRPDGE